MAADYVIRKERSGMIEIAKKDGKHYAYWNNRLKRWIGEDDPKLGYLGYGTYNGFEDGLHVPISEEEVGVKIEPPCGGSKIHIYKMHRELCLL